MHSRLSATRRVGRGARNNGQKMSRATSSGGGLKTGMVAKGPSSSASSNSNSKDVLTSSDDENDPTSCPDHPMMNMLRRWLTYMTISDAKEVFGVICESCVILHEDLKPHQQALNQEKQQQQNKPQYQAIPSNLDPIPIHAPRPTRPHSSPPRPASVHLGFIRTFDTHESESPVYAEILKRPASTTGVRNTIPGVEPLCPEILFAP